MEILTKVHSEVCGLEGPTLAQRIQRTGYFWPEMRKKTAKIHKNCEQCQMVIDVGESYFVEKISTILLYKQLPQDIPTSMLVKENAERYSMKGDQLYRRSV